MNFKNLEVPAMIDKALRLGSAWARIQDHSVHQKLMQHNLIDRLKLNLSKAKMALERSMPTLCVSSRFKSFGKAAKDSVGQL